MLQVLILSNLNLFKMNTFTARPRFAQSWYTANPLDATLAGTRVCVANKRLREICKPFRCNTYKKQGEGSPRSCVNTMASLAGACELEDPDSVGTAWSALPTPPSTFNRRSRPFQERGFRPGRNSRLSTSSVPLIHGSRNTDHGSRSLLSLWLPRLPSSVRSSKFRIP